MSGDDAPRGENFPDRVRLQAEIAELGLTALESSDWERVAEEALGVVSRELRVPLCSVLEFLPDQRRLVIRKARGWSPAVVGSTIPAGSGSQAGYTLVTGRPVVIDDMTTETRFRIPQVVHDHGAVSGLSVIMTGPQGPFGVLGAHTRERRAFTEDDLHFVQSVANIVATAVYRARTEGRIREREIQFLQAQKMDAVGLLAGGVAHDFNNLLTVILGCTDTLLARVHAADPTREDLLRIQSAGDRAATLIRQLLAFSSRQVMEPRVLSLGELLEKMRGMLERLCGAPIRLLLTGEEGLWPIRSDPGQIEQVMVNLVLNARDAMPRGGSLVVRAANVSEADLPSRVRSAGLTGPCVLLTVADTGQGIPAEMLSRIFEPFFTTKPMGRGVGLGLAGVYGIVQQHQGTITVDSAPGRGAVFSLYFPRSFEPAIAGDDAPRPGNPPPGHESILLVEDEDVVRTLEARVLTGAGYRVHAARSPDEALEAVHRLPGIDLVITDVVMPGLSGPELVDRLRAELPGLRVLFVSGYAREALPDGRLSQKGEAFLQKPFHPEVFLHSVREVLDQN